jgi:hypothetical protein
MKHRSIQELFAYWNTRRGRRAVPDRADIEPGAIRHVLADTFILSFDESNGHPFRVAGTRVCAIFGRELKNQTYLGLWTIESRALARDLAAIVADESIGVVGRASGAGIDCVERGLELMLLPLSHRGATDSRVLGALAPIGSTDWLGESRLGLLTMGTVRYLGQDRQGDREPQVASRLPAGRIRRGLVVYDGGRT